MSFGFSPSDIVTLIQLTKRAYDGWKTAGAEYRDLTQTLNSFEILVSHIQRRLQDQGTQETSLGRRRDVDGILRGCKAAVTELYTLHKRFRRLTHLDRLLLGTKDISRAKERLVRHTSMLTPILLSAELETVGHTIRSLPTAVERIPTLIRNALPAALGNVIDARMDDAQSARDSVLTAYGDDDKQAYKELRQELRELGIRDADVREHKKHLKQFMRSIINETHPPSIYNHQSVVDAEPNSIAQPDEADQLRCAQWRMHEQDNPNNLTTATQSHSERPIGIVQESASTPHYNLDLTEIPPSRATAREILEQRRKVYQACMESLDEFDDSGWVQVPYSRAHVRMTVAGGVPLLFKASGTRH